MALSDDIVKDMTKKLETKKSNIEYFEKEIIIIDAQKEPYDNAIVEIDKNILADINSINSSMESVQSAYQARINSGCKSDLFWRIESETSTDFNLIAEKLPNVGYAESFRYIDPDTLGITTANVGDAIIGNGNISQNLYAIRYKDQPYVRKDIGDTTVGTFIGVVGSASTELAIVSAIGEDFVADISVGNLIISTKDGVFSPIANTIVGFGSTTIFATEPVFNEIVGIATTSLQVSTLLLQDTTVGFSSLPESDGSYVSYTVIWDPDTFEASKGKRFRYSIPLEKNPFSKETVGIIDSSNVGIGVSINVVKSGNPSATQDWKPEYEGTIKGGEKVKFPKVGGGKIYYSVGFDDGPVDFILNPVSRGDTRTVPISDFDFNTGGTYNNIALPLYDQVSGGSGCGAADNAITDAENARDTLISNSGFGKRVDTANALRIERADYAIRIWTLRQSIGGENAKIDEYSSLVDFVNNQEII